MSGIKEKTMKKTAAVIGTGLIGGSIGKALLAGQSYSKVIGIGRNRAKLRLALTEKAVSSWSTDYSALKEADLVIICTPVVHIEKIFAKIGPNLKPGCIVTDAGSTKERIVKSSVKLPKGVFFVGSHPIAGSHKRGVGNADGRMFLGTLCIVTPPKGAQTKTVNSVAALWNSLGCRVMLMSPIEHDRTLALTSHVPHFTASALALAVLNGDKKREKVLGKGFLDTTRIAAGSPELWCEIAASNRKNIVLGIEKVISFLKKIKKNAGSRKLLPLLAKASRLRGKLK